MSGELRELEEAARTFDLEAEDEYVDLRRLSTVIHRLQAKQCRVAAAGTRRGEHLLGGESPTSWTAGQCQLSKSAAADRLCVGEQLPKLPEVALALNSGEIGYQAASVICHLQERLAEAGAAVEESEWVFWARE